MTGGGSPFDAMLRPLIMRAAGSDRIREAAQRLPVTRRVVDRFIPGETLDDALSAVRTELSGGALVSVDHLGEDTLDEARAQAVTDEYLALVTALGSLRVTMNSPAGAMEVSVKLTALGQSLPRHGAKIAEEHAHTVCAAARTAGVLVTVDAEDHRTTEERLRIVGHLRHEFDDLGTVLQAYLRRTEDDCRALSDMRIRLCKGAYAEPATVAFTDRAMIDEAYLRCLRILMRGNGYPMVASHDPTIIGAAGQMAAETGRDLDRWEHQMLYGIRTDEQRRLAADGNRIRVYLPYGAQWYGYFLRRLAERPANLAFFLRALAGR